MDKELKEKMKKSIKENQERVMQKRINAANAPKKPSKIICNKDEYAENMKMTAQQLLRDEMSDLGKELNDASPDAKINDLDKLRKHNQILDRLMLRMLSNADNNSRTDLKQYSIALRAQNQYRQTLLAKDVLERRNAKQIERSDNLSTEKENEPQKPTKYTHPQSTILDITLADKTDKPADSLKRTEQNTQMREGQDA